MSKRLTAALLASLTFAAVLAVVPLASPASAHSQTKQQCAYDPFAGNQCWTVNVSHTHSCPSGMTGTYPNCYPAPSTNQQNKGDEEAKKAAEEARKKAEEEAKRKAEEEAKRKKAEEEAKRKADEEAKRKKAEEEGERESGGRGGQKNCSTGQHRHSDGHDCTSGHTHDDDGGTGTGGTSDPCGDYADDLIAALNQPNSDGSYSLPNHPEGCSGASTREKLGRVRVFGADAARLFKQAFEKAMEYQGEATENQGEMFDGIDELLTELAKLWDETPNPAKAAALGVACFFLIPAEEVSSLTPAGTAVTAAQVATCSAALGLASEIISYAASDSDDGNGQGENDGSSNDDTGSTPSTPAGWDNAVDEAEEKWRRNEIDGDELTRIQNQRDCAYNRPWATNCP